MPKIKARKWGGSKYVIVKQKGIIFGYEKPSKKDLKRKGRRLDISTRGRNNMTISLNGTQINTVKKILKAVGEI